MKKVKLISKLLFAVNILVGISLLLAYVAPTISPNKFWPLAFFGLAFPYTMLCNVAFVLLWAFRANPRFLFSLIILILGYKTYPAYFQLNLDEPDINEKEFKVLSFNVRVFDLYLWSEEKSTRNKIFDFLNDEQADVLCLQEFYQTDTVVNKYDFKTLDTLKQFLKTKNYHVEYTTELRGTDHWGIITFSKYPIVGKGIVPFALKDDNICIFTDINKDGRTIRVYNAHLASIKLDKHDYKAMQKINENKYSENFDREFLMIEKIRYGFERRAYQADSIAKSIRNSPYPVILCGDFNDTPSSYAYQNIKGDLLDAYIGAGSGLGRTYIGEFPSYRIDYIFHDSVFKAIDYQTHPHKLSDHHPISSRLILR